MGKVLQLAFRRRYVFSTIQIMNKVNFVTMSGIDIVISEELLAVESVTNRAKNRYGTEVICIPGVFGVATVCTGWKILKKDDASVLGYLLLSTGWIMDPEDFEYGVNMFIPFSSEWSQIHGYKLRYLDGKLQIEKQ